MTNAVATVPTIGPRVRTAIVVGVIGVLMAIGGGIMLGRAFLDIINGPVYTVPATIRTHLGSGTYDIFENTGSGSRFGPVTIRNGRAPAVDAATVRVTGPGGRDVTVFDTSYNETITSGSDQFTSVVRFRAPIDGTYSIRIQPATATRVMIEHPLGDTFRDNVRWFVLVLAGGATAVLALILLFIGIARRRSARRAMTPFAGGSAGPYTTAPPMATGAAPSPTATPTTYPPGTTTPAPVPAPSRAPADWYPDPSGQHRLRYWDGHAWTDHVAD